MQTQLPEIGAQVFIEPGQSREQIESWFRLLQANDMTVCRIRMFEDHMLKEDGNRDFSRYDHAFDMAEKYGVKILATLFPSDKSIGGFKFPRSDEHQEEIGVYIRAVVSHFKDHPALDTWVLQNEPGSAWGPWNDYTEPRFEKWKKENPPVHINEYLKADYSRELFWRDYTTGYLSWLAEVVRSMDTKNKTHLNNHMLFQLLKEYDFPAWMPFLSTLGASIHAAWHLSYFEREEYPMAIAANCDMIRSAAGEKPFWVTELQGGVNTFSGMDPLTPTDKDIARWLWTCVGSGAERTIFWTLNARASQAEAGEWAMLDFHGKPTNRLKKAGEIASVIKKEEELFRHAKPEKPNITILYSPLSMITFASKLQVSGLKDQATCRSEGAHIKSVLAWYKALMEMGIACNLQQFDQFDWDSEHHTLILATMVNIPHSFPDKMKKFVENGNTLIVSGMTGLFDENMHNVFMSSDPYRKLFGASLSEFQYKRESFSIDIHPDIKLPVQHIRGIIDVDDAKILCKAEENVLAVENNTGKGKLVWIPSNIGIGAREISNQGLKNMLQHYIPDYQISSCNHGYKSAS